MAEIVSMNNLLEAGVQFGHQTKRWNPKMKEYIFTSRDEIHIINLEKTVECMEKAYAEIKKIAENGGKFLFVGTKKQASEVCIEEATRSESFYVTERWLGGTLTNFRTIRRRVRRLEEIENMENDGSFELLPKKEVIGLKKEYDKLNKVLSGIRNMDRLPNALIIVDPKKEVNAIREARKLNIPVIGIVDTNCDPDDVDFVIPGNDDAVRSVKVILGALTNAICEVRGLEVVDYITDIEPKKATKKEDFKEEIKKDVKKVAKKIEEKKEKIVEKVEEIKENLSTKTVSELKKIAKEKGITGYTSMKKDELLNILKK